MKTANEYCKFMCCLLLQDTARAQADISGEDTILHSPSISHHSPNPMPSFADHGSERTPNVDTLNDMDEVCMSVCESLQVFFAECSVLTKCYQILFFIYFSLHTINLTFPVCSGCSVVAGR